jgi:hypothetical protein
MLTEAGALSIAAELVNVIAAPPAGAACVKLTVQVADAFAAIAGAQTSDDTPADGVKCTVVFAAVPL